MVKKQEQGEVFDFSTVENLGVLDKKATIQTDNVIGEIYIPSVEINLPILSWYMLHCEVVILERVDVMDDVEDKR